jgi:hypothetical protein
MVDKYNVDTCLTNYSKTTYHLLSIGAPSLRQKGSAKIKMVNNFNYFAKRRITDRHNHL